LAGRCRESRDQDLDEPRLAGTASDSKVSTDYSTLLFRFYARRVVNFEKRSEAPREPGASAFGSDFHYTHKQRVISAMESVERQTAMESSITGS